MAPREGDRYIDRGSTGGGNDGGFMRESGASFHVMEFGWRRPSHNSYPIRMSSYEAHGIPSVFLFWFFHKVSSEEVHDCLQDLMLLTEWTMVLIRGDKEGVSKWGCFELTECNWSQWGRGICLSAKDGPKGV